MLSPHDMVLVKGRHARGHGRIVGRVIELRRGMALVKIANHGGHPEWIPLDRIKPWRAKNAKRKELAR